VLPRCPPRPSSLCRHDSLCTFPSCPSTPILLFDVVYVPPYHVRVSLHDGLLLQGTFVAFDRVMNPVLRDCIELYPQAGRLATRPFLFPSTTLVSMTIETLYSSPPMIAVSMFTAGSSTPSGGYVGGGPRWLSSFPISSSPLSPTDWVADSGVSFHTTPDPRTVSLPHPHNLTSPSIIVGNGSPCHLSR
jgi:small nuclear ribonucleoprotein (snRNP)-like protein